ncbi:MAG TPA: hypothetical protein PLH72_13620 [Vicinamibacterales bacterium]|mgnify:CR=1 FL=1|nr:hypothetical protein [Vicinamibacterales bacterium]
MNGALALHPASRRGMALVAVLLVSVLMGTVGLGLSLMLAIQHLAVRNARESATLAYAAAAGLEIAARALDDADWQAVLAGTETAPDADGPPSGRRWLDGGDTIDLDVQTHLANCGAPAACSAGALQAVTSDRPWGANNPTWRLFLYGPLATLAPFERAPSVYVLVWAADDGREQDDDPDRDGAATGGAGARILLLRAVAVGRGGGRRGFEAEAARICRAGPGGPGCQPGIRVQSWRDLRWSVP